MEFRKATDILCGAVTHTALAEALGVSVATVRQARLSPDAGAHRSPPGGWPAAVIKLAEARAKRLQRLADQLRGEA